MPGSAYAYQGNRPKAEVIRTIDGQDVSKPKEDTYARPSFLDHTEPA